MGDGFYRSKDPTNSINVLKEATKEKSDNAKNKIHICTDNNRQERIQIYSTTIPLVYTNMV